ncbi:DUF397 domain-containing protein [Streptomyces sp. NPDC048281]|uniref:DUF397 domain-containing protein n=1 Tax=Streptomyces sp. NPDC048281 TaxID=3154715 RepID=UPI0034239625
MSNTRTQWTKSSYSSGEGEACVEWRHGLEAGAVAEVDVADSKDSNRSTVLSFTPASWSAFVTSVKG